MGVSWTTEQQQVIDLRNRNILVSAAAGSGKTAVLVARIIKMITDAENPVDIDRLLIVTFTNAAAAEMRERIGAAIGQALLQEPENEHLQRQLTLIHNAQITTIDSFCLYVIRNHFHEIDLEPNFRIGDEGELKLLREDVLKRVLEKNYEEPSPAFSEFVDGYAAGRSDAKAGELILSLYEFSRSYPWPKEWLLGCADGYAAENAGDLTKAAWMEPLLKNVRFILADIKRRMEKALALTQEDDGPQLYEKVIRSDLEKYERLSACTDFFELYREITGITYDRLPSSRGFLGDEEKLARVKELRADAKELLKKLTKQYFFSSPEVLAEQLCKTAPMARELVRLALEFAEAFAEEKKRKNLVDFHDLEHFALNILVDGQTKQARRAAEEFRDTFAEIMIDEYQDSNYVQETILRTISTEERGVNNIFMVGDVKQSIYRFRLARPELFMEKYDTYSLEESMTQRVDLHRNFRSREEVLSYANDICERIMARDLGNVAYDEAAALYPGAVYPKPVGVAQMFAPELLLADSDDALFEEQETKERAGAQSAGAADGEDKKLLEARMVARRIQRLMEEQLVTDKETGELRRVRYSDIVILLRSLSGWADAFAGVLNEAGIPAYTVLATGYFSAVEVQTVLSMLRILDNPRQDIPLAAVLRSPIVGMTDEELARLRLTDKDASFHDCVLQRCALLAEAAEDQARAEEQEQPAEEQVFEQKLHRFYTMYQRLRQLVPDTPIHELIEILLKETGYGNYAAAMPAGRRRRANLQMLVEKAIAYENTSYKGLFHFVRYIDELQKYDVDFGEADLMGEQDDVVRIMSIHKSKGLEFPVVFVSGLGKNFNRQDVRSRMVLHPEFGMGLDRMDGKRRVKTPTIAKRAIAKQIDLENLGEELRVLYVALTRAKEKLILTGCRKDAQEQVKRARQQETLSGPLYYADREGASGYLDWLIPAVCSYGERYEVHVTPVTELLAGEVQRDAESLITQAELMEEIKNADQERRRELEERFSFRYPHEEALTQKNKYSVSELKHRAMRERQQLEDEETTPVFLQEELVPYLPPFVRKLTQEEEPVNQGALRGTAMHRVMECYDFASGIAPREQIAQMLSNGSITEETKALVKLPMIERFLESELGVRMRAAQQAGRLYREKAFVMGFTQTELAEFGFGERKEKSETDESADGRCDDEDLTLIQGIIDVFWEEDDGLVVLDYKTDRVDTAGELAGRYAAQLVLYGEALERLYQKGDAREVRVKERLLYSFRLGQIVQV